MPNSKAIINRRARYDYHLGDKVVAGIALSGKEVRKIRDGRVSIKNAFVEIRDDGAWLQNLEVFEGEAGSAEKKIHRLLLTKNQLRSIKSDLGSHNTIVPLRLILGRYIKIEVAAALGKKKYDKRETIKQRENRREIDRELKKGRRA